MLLAVNFQILLMICLHLYTDLGRQIFATVLKSWHGSPTLLYNCFRYVKESEDDIINFPIKTFLLAYFFLQKTVVTSKEYVHVEYLDCKRITEFRTFYRTA